MYEAVEQIGGRALGVFEPSPARLERLGQWFAAEHGPLLRFAYFVTGDRASAEDLVQEAFLRVYRAGGRAEQDGIATYARKTIVNLSRSAFRRRGIERRALASLAHPSGVSGAHDPGPRDEVWAALARLSPQQRACMALRYYEDMTEQQIADTLGVSLGAVKKQIARATERCRRLLGDRRES
jgi:RNA polymerase sigma-70 factor (sigma-E family)